MVISQYTFIYKMDIKRQKLENPILYNLNISKIKNITLALI